MEEVFSTVSIGQHSTYITYQDCQNNKGNNNHHIFHVDLIQKPIFKYSMSPCPSMSWVMGWVGVLGLAIAKRYSGIGVA